MSVSVNMTEWIRLVATPQDKQMLEAIKLDNGDDTISSTVRRLIRVEAKRRGLTLATDASEEVIPELELQT